MTSLIRSELRRVASRRLFHVLVLVFAAALAFIAVVVFLSAKHPVFATVVPRAMHIASDVLFTWGVVAGASFIGAEWSTGSMGTLLTWEPRRGRVLVAKLVAMSASAAVVALFFLVLVVVVLIPSGVAHGTMAHLDGTWWRDVLGSWWRGGALVAMGAGLGVGLAGLLRNSAGAIAGWLIFQFVVSNLLTVWKPGWFRWLPEGNVQLFLFARSEAVVNGQRLLPHPNAVRGGLTLLVYAAAVVAASYGAFRARDVT